jgi:hypothetical protein
VATTPYSLEDAETDIATLRGLVDRLTEAVTLTDATDPPTNPATGAILYSLTGDVKYASADGGDYTTGRNSLYTTADQLVTATSGVAITGLTCPVAAGLYRVHAVVTWTQGSGAFAQNFWLDGPAASHVHVPYFFALENSGVSNGISRCNALGSGGGATMPSPAFAAGSQVYLYFDGIIVFTAAGTFQITCDEGTSGHSFTVNLYSVMDVMPVA